MIRVEFTVPGEPQGKGRARSTKTGHHYTPAKTALYERTVALFAAQAMRGRAATTVPVKVFMVAYFGVPRSWSTKKRQSALEGVLRPTGKPDASNVAKAAEDACNGIVWRDDAQIVDLRIVKRYADAPGLTVEVIEA